MDSQTAFTFTPTLETATRKARPFLKWAGGKGQLVPQLSALFPAALRQNHIARYVEPFLGGGALFFHIAQTYQIEEYFLYDVNPELIGVYRSIQSDVEAVIGQLEMLQTQYLRLEETSRKVYFYKVREQYNTDRHTIGYDYYRDAWSQRAAYAIFLNRTCFNGLYRMNSKGEFNVPFGDYKNPKISDADNLRACAALLQPAQIACQDFALCESIVNENTFVYFDPPYRPLNATSHFTAYSRQAFNDDTQRRLATLYHHLDSRGASVMLSNSDPKNTDPEDDFFDTLYTGFTINRVTATRMINAVASKRGAIAELVITNYL